MVPGLAVGEELASRGHEVTILETGREVEALALKGWKGASVRTGPADYSSSGGLAKLFKLMGSRLLSTGVLRALEPDVLLAMGGYASIGPVLAARKLKIPVILHEGNAVPGKAVRFLAGSADAIASNFESTQSFFKGRKVTATGFPVRHDLIEAAKGSGRAAAKRFTLLVIGGSQGAGFLNEWVPETVRRIKAGTREIKVIHIAGEQHEEDVKKRYEKAAADADVFGFVQQMADVYLQADAAIARAGASVCAELAVFGIPSLFVPLPSAADDHQSANARHYSLGGGAKVIAQQDFGPQKGAEFLESLLSSEETRKTMSNGMLSCAVIAAAGKLADLVEEEGE